MRPLQVPALLPAGLRDLLPSEAAAEARLVYEIVGLAASHGYELVKPPLLEFEETLLNGASPSLSRQTFRLMDPLSQRMMAVRRDITMQVARIAGSRLSVMPRPLRLAYAGEVLRVAGTQLYPERQFLQVGCELIGAATPEADAEIVLLAAEALAATRISGISVDLNLPTLVPQIIEAHGLEGQAADTLLEASENRDPRPIRKLDDKIAYLFDILLGASGDIDVAFPKLDALDLPDSARADLERLRRSVAIMRAECPDLRLTIDPLERRGFEYHQSLSFTLFAEKLGEVGRGGRYRTRGMAKGESAIGFTLLTENLLRGMPATDAPGKVFIPCGVSPAAAASLRHDGYVTLRAMNHGDAEEAARAQGCRYIWNERLIELENTHA